MAKQLWKPGNLIYPVPAVIVTAADQEGKTNMLTIAWTGTICTNPPMAYISVRPERYSYTMIRETGEFVINLTTRAVAAAADYCGVRSGRDVDKWKETGLTPEAAAQVKPPLIKECPVNIECKVRSVDELGSHHMFIADVLAVHVDEAYLDDKGRFDLKKADLIAYSHGEYTTLGQILGTFGYSVKKPGGKNKKPAPRTKSEPKTISGGRKRHEK